MTHVDTSMTVEGAAQQITVTELENGKVCFADENGMIVGEAVDVRR